MHVVERWSTSSLGMRHLITEFGLSLGHNAADRRLRAHHEFNSPHHRNADVDSSAAFIGSTAVYRADDPARGDGSHDGAALRQRSG
jgi:hypothetical protein